MVDPVTVGLADAIEALRGELDEARRRGSVQEIQFQLDPVELVVQVTVSKDASGKIGWSVLGLGGSYQAANTQTLTLKLTPVLIAADGTPVKDFTIAGVLEPTEQHPGPRK
jgi:hypothetical protein